MHEHNRDFPSKIGSLAVLAGHDGVSALSSIMNLLKATRGDAVHSNAVIDKALELVPTIAAENFAAATVLIMVLLGAAQGDDARSNAIIDKGLEIAPTVTVQDGYYVASLFVGKLADAAKVDTSRGLMTQEFMLATAGSQDGHPTLVFFGASPEKSRVISSWFDGPLAELGSALEVTQGEMRAEDRLHFNSVLTTALDALRQRDQLPPLRHLASSPGP